VFFVKKTLKQVRTPWKDGLEKKEARGWPRSSKDKFADGKKRSASSIKCWKEHPRKREPPKGERNAKSN